MGFIRAQIPVGQWRTHHYYGRSLGLSVSGGRVYSNSGFSLLRYDVLEGDIGVISRTQGLSVGIISSLEAFSQGGLAVGFDNGWVNVWKGGRWHVLGDVFRSSLRLDKQIRVLYRWGDYLYVGGAFGLLVYDWEGLTLMDAYLGLGMDGGTLEVFSVLVHMDSLFLSTSEGLIHASLDSRVNRLDFMVWRRPMGGVSGRGLALYGGILYSLGGGKEVLEYRGGRWEVDVNRLLDLGVTYDFIGSSGGGLWVGSADILHWWDMGGQRHALRGSGFRDAHIGDNVWVSSVSGGLGMLEGGEVRYIGVSSPVDADRYALVSGRGSVYAFNADNARSLSLFEGGIWEEQVFSEGLRGGDILSVSFHEGLAYVLTSEGDLGYRLGGEWIFLDIREEFRMALRAGRSMTSWRGGLLISTSQAPHFFLHYEVGSRRWSSLVISGFSGYLTHMQWHLSTQRIWALHHLSGVEEVVALDFEEGILDGFPLPSASTEIHALLVEGDRVFVGSDFGLFTLSTRSLADNFFVYSRLFIDGRRVLTERGVYAFWLDGGEKLWIATEEEGLWVLERDFIRLAFRFDSGNSPLPSSPLTALSGTEEGELFVGTSAGLLSYRTRTSTPGILNKVRVFPNPVHPNYEGFVSIDGLPFRSLLRIATASGAVLRVLRTQGGLASWDLLDSRGRRVDTGVYFLYSVGADGSGEQVAKLAVVRR